MNIPKLRFKGFNDEWCKKYLKDIGNTYTGLTGKTKEDFGHGKAHFITFLNVLTNPITDKSMLDKIEIDNKQHQVQKGDVFFNTSSETPEEVGMSSVWDFTDDNIYLNSFCFAYRPFIKFNNYFLAYNLRSPLMRKKIRLLAQGISRYNISKNKLMEKMIYYPSLSEQQKIGSLFAKLDNLIDLQAKKLELLKQLKQGLLQKLFPQNNQTTPQFRFKGFNDEWKCSNLDDLNVYFTDGNYSSKYPKSNDFTSSINGVPFLKGNNLSNGFIFTKNLNYITKKKNEELISGHLLYDDVVIAVRGSIGNIGYVNYDNEGWNINSQLAIIRTNKRFLSGSFLRYFLLRNSSRIQILSLVTGTALKQLPLKSLKTIRISYTKLEEQEKISALFANLDNLLTKAQEKITLFKQVKKYLLQRMFI